MIFHDTLYILCPQITLDNNFLAYLNGVLKSRSALRTGVISASYQQSFEITTGTQSFKDNFRGLNKQIEWLEISVYDKSDQNQTIFDSYGVELAAKFVQVLALENPSTRYSLTGHLKKINAGHTKCLSLIIAMDVAQRHLPNTKITK